MTADGREHDAGGWLRGIARSAGAGEGPVAEAAPEGPPKPYGGLEQSFVDGLARRINLPIDPGMGRDQIMALDHLANGGAATLGGIDAMPGIPVELRLAALGANQDLAKQNDAIALQRQWEAEAAEKARLRAEEERERALAEAVSGTSKAAALAKAAEAAQIERWLRPSGAVGHEHGHGHEPREPARLHEVPAKLAQWRLEAPHPEPVQQTAPRPMGG